MYSTRSRKCTSKFTSYLPMVGDSADTPASSTTKTGRDDIAEILLKNTKNQIYHREIQNPRWPPWSLIGCNIFDLFHRTTTCQVTKCARNVYMFSRSVVSFQSNFILAFQSFNFKCTRWRLFQKLVVCTKFDIYVFITITGPIPLLVDY